MLMHKEFSVWLLPYNLTFEQTYFFYLLLKVNYSQNSSEFYAFLKRNSKLLQAADSEKNILLRKAKVNFSSAF